MAVSKDSRKPQFKNPMYNDIYMHLITTETKKRPDMFYLKAVQHNLNISHIEETIKTLVQLADYYKFMSKTVYLAVKYIDSYLSQDTLQDKDELLLVGLCCFIIAARDEQPVLPAIQHICQTLYYFIDGDYEVREFKKEEVLLMEKDVKRYLN